MGGTDGGHTMDYHLNDLADRSRAEPGGVSRLS